MKKRILSILLLCCMLLTLLPTTAFAADELPDVKLSVPTKFDKIVDLTKQNQELKIKDSKTYLIKGSTDPNWYFQHRIKIDGKNNTPHIFLDGVRLQAPKDGPAIELYGGASACLYFIGNDSELIGAENFAALQKNKTDGYLRVLVQTGTKLTCEGGRYGAGIGGSKVGIKKFSQGHGMNLHFGSLATGIYGGEILATSGVYGAGIGGGQGGVGEQIYVYSGKLTVRSVSEGAGIGGGQGGPGRFIYIKGGTVNAGSESGGAGIGSGDQDGQNKSEDAHHIEISGGTVEAWSNYAGAGIGGGRGGSGYDISITGGVVRAQGYYGAGIGGGMNGDSGNILIKDTTLTALALPLYPSSDYTERSASAVGRGSNWVHYMTVIQDQEFAMTREENIKIEASDGKSVRLSATGWQWRPNQGTNKLGWGTTTELLIGCVDLQRLSLPYAYNYGRVISELELRCEESTHNHEFGWAIRDDCHIWACKKCGARDPAAEMSKQNGKHIPGVWRNQEQLCAVCGHVIERDTKAPVMETLTDGESYTVEDTPDGKPGAYTFTVSDPAASGEASSGVKSVTINGVSQALGSFYSLPAPDGSNNDAGAEYTVVATDNAGNETTATVRTYRRYHVKVISPDGGTASASSTSATAGTEITLTATPNTGYHFKKWQVESPAGLVITNNKFTMPDSNVAIKAIFEEDSPFGPTKYTVTVTTEGGGTASASPAKAAAGTEITLTATPNKGYRFKEWQVIRGGVTIKDDKFIMPEENVDVKAIFEEIPAAEFTITVTDGKATIGAGSEISKAAQGTTITLTANAAPAGMVFDKWVVESGSATLEDANSETTTFIMPDSEVSVKVTYKNAPVTTYSLTTQVNGGHGTISESKTGLTEGSTETVIFTPDNGYEIDIVTVNGVATDVLSNTLNVTMDADKTVIVTYKAISHTHTYDQEIQKPETLKSAADCTNDAVYFKSCSCGEISTTETFTAAGTQLGHAWASDWSKDTDNHWKECSRCYAKKDEAAHDYGSDNICDTCGYDKTVPHTHNLTLVPAKASACTEKGNTAYYTCDGCDKWFEDATGASEITDKTSVILAATGHSVSDWKSDNTDHWKECTVVGCGVVIEGSKAAHTAGEWIIDTPATATTSGLKHKECTVCGYTMATETIPATGGGEHTHSYGSEWKNDADNHWHECSCGDKADKAAHTAGEWIIDTPATATTSGSKHKECTVCGYTMATETIPATGGGEHTHSYGSEWKNDADNHWHECSCGDKADKAAHTAGEWIIDTPATATTSGTKHKKCTVCGYTMATETIPATGGGEHTHSYGSEWKNDADNHWKECTVVGCGVIIEGSKAAHTAGEWIIDTPATTTTSGTKHKKCTVCGYTMATETIPATGGGEHTHSYGSEWKNDADNHWHECSCGDKDDVAAHSFKWVVDKEATATKKGSKHEECKVCGYKKAAVEIPATGSTTKPTDPTQTNPNTGAESPKTDDNSNRILWIALLFIIGGAVIGITVYRKKKKENAE